MLRWRLLLSAALLGFSLTFSACGESPDDGGAGLAGDAATPPTVPTPNAGGGGKTKECVFPPHTKGSGSPRSPSHRRTGRRNADCDGDSTNGCEVALTGADACAACPAMAAMRCLQPTLCGLTQPVCTPMDGTIWTSQGPIVDSEISSLVVGPDSAQAFAVTSRSFDASKATTPSPSATLFGMKLAEGGGLQWAANGTGAKGRIYRVGDRLYLHSATPDRAKDMNVGAFSLDGKLLWSQSVPDSETAIYSGGLAVDASGNVYITGDHESSGGQLVVALDSTGKERWRKTVGSASSSACRPGISTGALLDLAFAGGKLIGLTKACLLEISTSSGAIEREQALHVWADNARLRSDAAGNVYVADEANPGDGMPIASLLGPSWTKTEGFPTNANAIYVSKYGPGLKHAWSHTFVSTGDFGSGALSNPSLRGFDVTSAGVGFLLGAAGEFPFVVQFDSEGKSVAASVLDNRLYPAHELAVAENGTPFLAGTFKTTLKDLGTGMFIWNLAFDKGGPVARTADAGVRATADAGAQASVDAGTTTNRDAGVDGRSAAPVEAGQRDQ